jgi:hypothetical protein
VPDVRHGHSAPGGQDAIWSGVDGPATAFFVLAVTRAADHRRPAAGTFQQRMTLLHRGTDRPTVLHTTGYGVPGSIFRAEPTRLVDGNQLSVEQRFFTPSRPAPADWSDLTIRQAAQLGYPAIKLPHLAKLQRYPGWAARTATAGAAPYDEVLDADNPALDRRAGLRR